MKGPAMPARRATRALVALAAAALAASAAGWALEPDGFMRAWLVAALFWLSLSLGSMPVMMAWHLTGGGWGAESEPVLAGAVTALPVALLALALPALFGLARLFVWTAPAAVLPEVVVAKLAWLNPTGFGIRTGVYMLCWLAVAWAVALPRRTAPPNRRGRAAAGIIVWVLATSFFAFDWLMSLEPEWYSDIFGLYVIASMGLAAMALTLAEMCLPLGRDSAVRAERRQDFVHLLLAVALAWAFLAYSQYLIVWMGNLPNEIGWYLRRRTGLWYVFGWAIVAGFFIVPVSALLFRRIKRSPRALVVLTAVILTAHLLHCAWLVLPVFEVPLAVACLVPVGWVAIGAPWLAVFARRLDRRPARAGTATVRAAR